MRVRKHCSDYVFVNWEGGGLKPHLRGDKVFICEPRRVLLTLGDFFSVLEYDEEVKVIEGDESVTNVLWNRRNPFDLEDNPYVAWHEEQQAEQKI